MSQIYHKNIFFQQQEKYISAHKIPMKYRKQQIVLNLLLSILEFMNQDNIHTNLLNVEQKPWQTVFTA